MVRQIRGRNKFTRQDGLTERVIQGATSSHSTKRTSGEKLRTAFSRDVGPKARANPTLFWASGEGGKQIMRDIEPVIWAIFFAAQKADP